jgi:hypothetical protein
VADSLTNNDDSTGLPLPLTMPQAHKNMAVVMATPMRMASTLLISGNVVIRQRKYTEVEMMDADAMRRPIYHGQS